MVILLLITGIICLKRLGVDLFPKIDIPVVAVTTQYAGSSPEEIENLISKPIEDELISMSGLKRLSSRNYEGMSVVIMEFTLETDIKYAEQQARDRVALARSKLPDGIEEPLIRQFDPFDIPVARVAVSADMPATQMYDFAKEELKTSLERGKDVGNVKIIGGAEREIQVELDRNKVNYYEISAVSIASKLQSSGSNVPVGKFETGFRETVFRSVGQFENLDQIRNLAVIFSGDFAGSIPLNTIATIIDGEKDRTSLGYLISRVEPAGAKKGSAIQPGKNAAPAPMVKKEALLLDVYRQSGTNTVAVADGVVENVKKLNAQLRGRPGNPQIIPVYDGARWIRINIRDVFETIIIGIILAIIVVYLFLGNVRSTIITSIALPNSLLGAFIIMYLMGFTINIMTLLALSLTVGLLIDDAIVVRENIFRRLEEGMHPVDAAEKGTTQVALAVIATTLTIIAVFLPIGFLKGIIGQFFKQFGLTVVFAMSVSLFDALTVAPMLSAYFAGKSHERRNVVVRAFDGFQNWLEKWYVRLIDVSLAHPLKVIGITTLVFFLSLGSAAFIKKTFMTETEEGEFMVNIEMPPGTSLDGTRSVIERIEERIKAIPEVRQMSTVVGGNEGDANKATVGVMLVPYGDRKRTSSMIKEQVRGYLKDFADAKPFLSQYSTVGGGSMRPFTMNVSGNDLHELEIYAEKLMEKLKKIPDLTEFSTSLQAGRPEFQVRLDPKKLQMVGASPNIVGAELRYHVAGEAVGKLHEKGLEYDVRLRLRPDQRNLKNAFYQTRVPNQMGQNAKLIPLAAISTPVEKIGSSYILRVDRARTIQVSANLAPKGGIGNAIDQVKKIVQTDLPMPVGMSYSFIGQTENFGEMVDSVLFAMVLSIIFIYLVLSSLYESFITPLTILMAIPPAISGAFIALLVAGEMFTMMSMIGIVMLLGLVTKNSILLVDFIVKGEKEGKSRNDAIREAGMVRLRPILMTTFAMIAGTIPVAMGWGEAAAMRTSMGVAIVGGLVVSTLITLFVVPAVYGYVDRFRELVEKPLRPVYEYEVSPANQATIATEVDPFAAEDDDDDPPGETKSARPKTKKKGRSKKV